MVRIWLKGRPRYERMAVSVNNIGRGVSLASSTIPCAKAALLPAAQESLMGPVQYTKGFLSSRSRVVQAQNRSPNNSAPDSCGIYRNAPMPCLFLLPITIGAT